MALLKFIIIIVIIVIIITIIIIIVIYYNYYYYYYYHYLLGNGLFHFLLTGLIKFSTKNYPYVPLNSALEA